MSFGVCSAGQGVDGDVSSSLHLLEVKCMPSKDGVPIREVADQKGSCLELVEGEVALRKKHAYYDQIQCQLCVTGTLRWTRWYCAKCRILIFLPVLAGKDLCHLVVATKPPGAANDPTPFMAVVPIQADPEWRRENIPKLLRFWHEYVAPEMADPSLTKDGIRGEPFQWSAASSSSA